MNKERNWTRWFLLLFMLMVGRAAARPASAQIVVVEHPHHHYRHHHRYYHHHYHHHYDHHDDHHDDHGH